MYGQLLIQTGYSRKEMTRKTFQQHCNNIGNNIVNPCGGSLRTGIDDTKVRKQIHGTRQWHLVKE